MQRLRTALLIAGLFFQPASLLADGGTLCLSQRVGDWQVSVFTSPEVLRVGLIDISVLVQDAPSGQIQETMPVTVKLECVDQRAIPLEQIATAAAATNKLFQAALFEVPQAGLWRASITIGNPTVKSSAMIDRSAKLAFDLSVSPPLPAWLELAPWVGWPFVIVALFLGHQSLGARHLRKHTAPSFPSHSLRPGLPRLRPRNG
jgi:hypothetical protein